jgi:aspartate/methionine/tyrosine aminotransferase
VIHLEIGEPDFDTPVHIREAAAQALSDGQTHYCPSAGLTEFREAAAVYMSAARGISISPGRVIAGTGSKPFIFFAVLATCDPGNEVIYPDPGFPIYESAIRYAGAIPVPLPLREERDFEPDPDEFASLLSERTRLVILNSPQNPTGAVIDAATLGALAASLSKSSAWVLSDEVYGRMVHDGSFATIATHPSMLDRTIVLDGLSKTFAMTGWRCGFAALPEPLVEPISRFFTNSTSCVPPFIQLAGIAALEGPMDDVDEMIGEFRRRRSLIVDGLNSIPGITCQLPKGAFYAFPNVSSLAISADDLARELLEEAGVAVLAGSAFGTFGVDYLRVSYANSRANLELALERIAEVTRAYV